MQVLVATMHQTDRSLIQKMNIRCSAVLANQADREEIESWNTEWGECKMITTPTRGVGLNRNIGLMAATDEILLLSDDDVVYNDDMPQAVTEAFAALPKADVIIFGLDMMKDGEVYERRIPPVKRLRIWNSMRFGTCRMAIKRKALIENHISFHQCFGGGCSFSSGEDSLFLKACFVAGLKVYSHSYVLGTCCKDSSSWFKGYNEKYFYDKGVLVRKLFPKTAYLMAIYFGVHFKRETKLGWTKRLRWVFTGVRAGKRMIPFSGDECL